MENNLTDVPVFMNEDTIQARVLEMAKQISTDYEGKEVIFIIVLKGSIFFATDLIRRIPCNSILEFMQVSSYKGTTSTNKLVVKKDLDYNICGKDVIIVEDIVDTGKTLSYLHEYLLSKNPNSLKIAVLLDKACKREVPINADYVGFEIEDKFVVGYGFDLDQNLRHLPYLGYFK